MAEAKNKKINSGGRKRKTSARRLSSSGRRKKERIIPNWVYIIVAALCSTLILAAVYYMFFRPYFYRFRPCYGQRHYSICMPLGHTVFGIDISHHQGTIDWEQVKAGDGESAPVGFVYMKATEGSDFTDKNFYENFDKAAEHGFIRGAYHYFSRHSDGLSQAKKYISTVKLQKGDLPPVVDVEERPKDTKRFIQELKIFISKIEEHYGVKPIIYSYKKYKERYLSDPYFDKYPLWVAHYYVYSLDENIDWLMWQCSDIGRVNGIKENVDINIFNGTAEQLQSILIK